MGLIKRCRAGVRQHTTPPLGSRAAELDELRAMPRDQFGNYLWPDDPDEVPRWVEICNAHFARIGAALLPYTTRRQRDAAEACALRALERETDAARHEIEDVRLEIEDSISDLVDVNSYDPDEMDEDDVRPPPLPELTPQAAACAFLKDLRWEYADAREPLRFTAREMWERYIESCEVEDRVACPQNRLLAAVGAEPGVSRRVEDVKGTHKRQRQTVYIVEPDLVMRGATDDDGASETNDASRRAMMVA